MTVISEIIERELKKVNDLKNGAPRRFVNIDPEDFKKLLYLSIDRIIAERKLLRKFELNKENKEIMSQFYYHLTGYKEKFKGDLQKGIMLVGKNGVGKTLLLQSYCKVRNILYGGGTNSYNSRMLLNKIKENGFDFYVKCELMIDDLGKESLDINDYGTKIQPMADLISFRYDNGALTFITSNYNMKTLSEFYGITTTDRFKEMFNIIELKGESFRK